MVTKTSSSTRPRIAALLWLALLASACGKSTEVPPTSTDGADPADARPNILLIMADDLGYSDIGPFGSEISTPTLDELARNGITFTNFRVHMMCSPTRAMLLTGSNSHNVGYGTMAGEYTDETRGQPGYETRLDPEVSTLANDLGNAGYRTMIAGKWDMGGRGDPALRPDQRGFDHSYVLVEGSGSHFTKRSALEELPSVTYVQNGQEVDLPTGFYSSASFTDKMIEFIGTGRQPFFAFLSFTAPHYPLQAPEEYTAKYSGRYDTGYKPVRDARIERQRRSGVFPGDRLPAERHPVWPDWEDLSDTMRAFEARRMEIYAGMIDSMDENIGRVFDHLEATGQLDNTVVVFLSDNGAEGGNPLDWGGAPWFEWAETSFDMSFENMGRPDSYVWAGPGWGYVSAAPFRYAKGFGTEGGIRSPLIFSGHGVAAAGRLSHANLHVLDLNATIKSLAGVEPRAATPSSGRTFSPILSGEAESIRQPGDFFAVELLGRRALVKGNWKITWTNEPWGPQDEWQLFNLAEDPGEREDLSDQNAAKKQELVALWNRWAEDNGVVPINVYPMGITNRFTHYEWLPASAGAPD